MPDKQITEKELRGIISDILKESVGATLDERMKVVADEQQKTMRAIFAGAGQQQQAKAGEKGILAAQYVRAIAAANHMSKRGKPTDAVDMAKHLFGSESPVAKALSATNFTEGGALVPTEIAAEVIELLRPASVIRSLNPVVIPMNNGTMEVPKLTGGATGSYMGENANVPKSEETFGNVKGTAKKLGVLVPMSNDLLRRNTHGADTIVRDDMVAGIGSTSDAAFIRAIGSQYTPKGLRYWCPSANVIPANGTVNLANVTVDLGKLWLALANANVRFLRPGFIMAPRTYMYLANVRDGNGNFAFRDELLRGRLMTYPFKFTTNVPVNLGGGTNESELYLTDFADVVIGETETLEITSSQEAAYHDGSNVVAAFSLDQTVVRAIIEHDLVMRHAESIAVLSAVTWGA